MRDMFNNLYYQGRLKGGEKNAVTHNLNNLVTELAEHYDQFQEYLDMDGGAMKKRKYDVVYHMVKDMTEKLFVVSRAASPQNSPDGPKQSEEKMPSSPKFSQDEEHRLSKSDNGGIEDDYQASNEQT